MNGNCPGKKVNTHCFSLQQPLRIFCTERCFGVWLRAASGWAPIIPETLYGCLGEQQGLPGCPFTVVCYLLTPCPWQGWKLGPYLEQSSAPAGGDLRLSIRSPGSTAPGCLCPRRWSLGRRHLMPHATHLSFFILPTCCSPTALLSSGIWSVRVPSPNDRSRRAQVPPVRSGIDLSFGRRWRPTLPSDSALPAASHV